MAARSSSPPGTRFVGLLMGGALLGKLLGFAREVLTARLLGVSFVVDSFRGALTAVLLPIAPMQGDIVPAVLVPLHRAWRKDGQAAPRFGGIALCYLAVATAIAVAVALAAGFWADAIVGGFGPRAHALTVRFIRIMALAMPASALLACLSAMELALGRSRLTSLRASIQNIAILGGVTIAGLTGHVLAIAWSFTLAFNLLAVWGSWTLLREGELAWPGFDLTAARAVGREFFHRLRPLMAQPLGEQGNIWLERVLGSHAGTGVVASLDYARTLTETALFLVSQPIGYLVLAADRDERDVPRHVDLIARAVLACAMPVSLAIAMFAPDIVHLVFARGAFGEHGVLLTGAALRGISVGLWASTLGWILVRMLNAQARNGAAAAVLVAAYAVNAVFNLVLVPRIGSLGLGLGEAVRSLTLLVGTVLALGCARPVAGVVLRMLPACVALGAVSYVIRADEPHLLLRLLFAGLACLATVAASLVLALPQAMRALAARLGRRRTLETTP